METRKRIDRRIPLERRVFTYAVHVPERRHGQRRSGNDRRKQRRL